eukprot:3085816-Pleurochrysis_carterae.AAC.2
MASGASSALSPQTLRCAPSNRGNNKNATTATLNHAGFLTQPKTDSHAPTHTPAQSQNVQTRARNRAHERACPNTRARARAHGRLSSRVLQVSSPAPPHARVRHYRQHRH